MDKDDSSKRRKTLDAFFAPQLTVTSVSSAGKQGVNQVRRENVILNDEQVQVLKMVVDEGKSVFFTGAAGEYLSLWSIYSLHTQTNPLFHLVIATLSQGLENLFCYT